MSRQRAISLNSKAWIRAARVEAWTAQNCLCAYCRSPLSRAQATADHKRAQARGGTHGRGNIAAACAWCNSVKGSLSDGEFLNLIKRRPAGLPPALLLVSIIRAINLRAERAVRRIEAFAR